MLNLVFVCSYAIPRICILFPESYFSGESYCRFTSNKFHFFGNCIIEIYLISIFFLKVWGLDVLIWQNTADSKHNVTGRMDS